MNPVSLVRSSKDTLLIEFLNGRSPNTIQSYKDDLISLSNFLNVPNPEEALSVLLTLPPGDANRLALNFRSSLQALGLASSTINRKMATIRSCVKFARMCGIINWNIEIQNLKSEAYRDTRGPGLPVFQKMIYLLKKRRCPKSLRDIAILRLMFDLGLRVSEVTQLNYSDLELSRDALWVQGKGRTYRQLLHLPNGTKVALTDWITSRGQQDGPLFMNFDRARARMRITRTGVYSLVRKLGLEAGVDTRPHGIRHLSITEACKAAQARGLPLEDVLAHSRHSSVSTLILYRDKNESAQEQISEILSKLA